MSHGRAFLTLLAVVGVSALALYSLCDALHRCGCRPPWAGGAAHCNVQKEAGPQCPWCAHPVLGAIPTAGAIGAQIAVFLGLRGRRGIVTTVGAALVSLPVSLVVLGAAAWLLTDYPHFLVQDLRGRLGLPAGPVKCVAPAMQAGALCCAPSRPKED